VPTISEIGCSKLISGSHPNVVRACDRLADRPGSGPVLLTDNGSGYRSEVHAIARPR
jgi:hypothetical protein